MEFITVVQCRRVEAKFSLKNTEEEKEKEGVGLWGREREREQVEAHCGLHGRACFVVWWIFVFMRHKDSKEIPKMPNEQRVNGRAA